MTSISVQRSLAKALLLCSLPVHASFIESTIGTAVVNDATAVYYNPAALTLLKNSQFIALGPVGRSQTQFSGQSVQLATGYTQSGTSNARLNYILPSFYFSLAVTNRIQVGVAVVENNLNRDIEGHSILRYAQSSNQVQTSDIVPGIGIQLNDYVSIGAGLNRSYAHFLLEPISGLPSLNIPDSQSRNETSDDAWGGDVGLLIKPTKSTIMGLNYRSAISFAMTGTSTFNGTPKITSNSYRFNYWTPARTVFSINHFVTPKLGLIGTLQFIQTSIFKSISAYNIATPVGIVPKANIPFNFHNSWLITLGSNYRISQKWIVRAAGSYTQSPSNGKFQIDTGDSLTLGASMGYMLSEKINVECSYAHAFIKDREVHLITVQNSIDGINKGEVDAFALKLILKLS